MGAAAIFGVLSFLFTVAFLIASDTLLTTGWMLLSIVISVLLVLLLFLYYS